MEVMRGGIDASGIARHLSKDCTGGLVHQTYLPGSRGQGLGISSLVPPEVRLIKTERLPAYLLKKSQ